MNALTGEDRAIKATGMTKLTDRTALVAGVDRGIGAAFVDRSVAERARAAAMDIDFAGAVLASSESDEVVGQTLKVGGGASMS